MRQVDHAKIFLRDDDSWWDTVDLLFNKPIRWNKNNYISASCRAVLFGFGLKKLFCIADIGVQSRPHPHLHNHHVPFLPHAKVQIDR